MILSRLSLSRSLKKVDDLQDFWSLHVFAALVLEEEEGRKEQMQCLETRFGVTKKTALQEIASQDQATRS